MPHDDDDQWLTLVRSRPTSVCVYREWRTLALMSPEELRQLRSDGNSLTLPARELIQRWGARRRTWAVVQQIAADMKQFDLRIDPPLVDVPLDEEVTISPIAQVRKMSSADSNLKSVETEPKAKRDARPGDRPQVRIKMFWIPAANNGVEQINPTEPISVATSRMMRFDYSQLAVMASPRAEPKAISWESVAKAQLGAVAGEMTAADASVDAVCVSWDDDLLPVISRISDQGFVFVRGRDRTLGGIVTTADLSSQFEEMAKPFLLLGEIERGLRVVLDSAFGVEELAQVRETYDKSRPVSSASDLTFGEMQRLLERPENFSRLGWAMERSEFVAAFDEVRDLRNDVMHFSPDALGEQDLRRLRNFQSMLQKLAPSLLA